MSSRVDRNTPRCPGCYLKPAWCLCGEIPRAESRTRLLIFRHREEAWKPTNSARILARCLSDTRIADWGGRGEVWSPPPLPAAPTFLLFPSADALPPSALRDLPTPPVVILIDGTWKQARKMARQIPEASALPRVALSPESASSAVLRRRVVEGGLSTAEAAAALLRSLGEEEAAQAVAAASALLVSRILESRGLPPQARATQLDTSNRAHWKGILQGSG